MIDLSVRKVINDSWELFKKDWIVSSFVCLIMVSLVIGPVVLFDKWADIRLIKYSFKIYTGVLMAPALFFVINWIRTEHFSLVFPRGEQVIKYLITYFILYLSVTIGMLLFIVPGYFLLIKLRYAPYLILYKDLEIYEALEESWTMTNGYFWQVTLIIILVMLVSWSGILLLIIGVIPFTVLAFIIDLNYFIRLHKVYEQSLKNLFIEIKKEKEFQHVEG